MLNIFRIFIKRELAFMIFGILLQSNSQKLTYHFVYFTSKNSLIRKNIVNTRKCFSFRLKQHTQNMKKKESSHWYNVHLCENVNKNCCYYQTFLVTPLEASFLYPCKGSRSFFNIQNEAIVCSHVYKENERA